MALWTPDRITTALWLDAADASTITESSGAVSQWADKSGNGHHAEPPSGSAPATGAATIGGKNVIRFDGVDDVLRGVYSGPLTAAIICVFRVTASSGAYLRIAAFRDSSVDALTLAISDNADRILIARSQDPEGRGSFYDSPRNTPYVLVGSHPNLEAGSESVRLNGSTPSVSGTSPLIVGNLIASSYSIGARWDAAFLAVDIAELFVVPEPPGTDLLMTTEGYLAHKWGLAANLPAAHPYKDSAPGLFDGAITDKDGNPAERRITVLNAAGHCVATDTSDPVTGAYSITVPAESPYTLVFDGEPDRNAQVFANMIPGESPA